MHDVLSTASLARLWLVRVKVGHAAAVLSKLFFKCTILDISAVFLKRINKCGFIALCVFIWLW